NVDIENLPPAGLIHLLTLHQNNGKAPPPKLLLSLLAKENADVRAHAVYLLGVNGYQEGRDALVKALADGDALVRRRACEALVRAGFEPPVKALWPLLGENDRFVRHAARLTLERIDPKLWAPRLGREQKDLIAWNGIVALCHTN